jgi:diguanylate cyclase (GGDEF)-like protein/PAS domain S-box-containing protein
MYQILSCISDDHRPVMLLIAALICAFGSVISLSIGRRALPMEDGSRRWRLMLAGLSTGLTIWSTHFAAMLAYAPGVEVRFNGPVMLASAGLAIAISGCAWLILSVQGRWRGYLGGAMIGLALCAAHFIDMTALRIEGLVRQDPVLLAAALAFGLPFCIATGVLAHRWHRATLPGAAACMTIGTLGLHLLAMSALQITPTAATRFTAMDLDMGGLTLLVILSSTFILLVGAGLALHDVNLARATSLERERLRRSEEHHRFSVALSPQIPWIADPRGQILEISPRWSEIVGQPVHKALGFGWCDQVHPDDLGEVLEVWKHAIGSGDDARADVRYRLRRHDGEYRWFRARARPRRDENGEIMLWYGSLEDIDEQVRAEAALRASEERYRLASLAANDVIWDMCLKTDVVHLSGAVSKVLGFPDMPDGAPRDWWSDRLHPEDRERVLEDLEATFASEADCWTQECRVRDQHERYLDVLVRGYAVRDADGTPVRLVGSLLNITARKRSEDELRWSAHHDPLTHLPNRKLFSLKLDAALAEATAKVSEIALVVVDIDGFKTLNDTLGHAAGDAALIEVGRRLKEGAPEHATVARLGGDEFAIILPGPTSGLQSDLLARIQQAMVMPLPFEGQEIDITLSIGAARFPADGDCSETLLKSADLALYAAKSEGVGNARLFELDMRQMAEIQKQMRNSAREALLQRQIVPYYQPKICLRDGSIIGFEALLRRHGPDGQILRPSTIQAAFDDPRLAPELTETMLEQIVADMASWQRSGHDFGRIAMNGSPEDFRRGDLASRILAALAREGVSPSRFELEITETVFLGRHADQVGAALRTLRSEGVTIALDDFGTGYASLTHLKQFQVDVLKIDQSFVSRLISEQQQDAAIVGALIDLAKNLSIQTVAEGVETQMQAFMLRRRGCDVGQGYFFSQPLAAADIVPFMEAWQPQAALGDWPAEPRSVEVR